METRLLVIKFECLNDVRTPETCIHTLYINIYIYI